MGEPSFVVRCSRSNHVKVFESFDKAERELRRLVSLGDQLICPGAHWVTPVNSEVVIIRDEEVQGG